MKTKHFAILALPLLMAACSSENEPKTDTEGQVELKLTATIAGPESRAFGYDRQFPEGTTIYVVVKDAEDGTVCYDQPMTVGADGALTGEAMYFPANGHDVNIYANNIGAWEYDSSGIPQVSGAAAVVQTSQAAYCGSDFCYVLKAGVQRTKKEVELVFDHMLSKIEVNLTEGAGDAGFLQDISKLEVIGVNHRWDFNAGIQGLAVEMLAADIELTHSLTDTNECVIGTTEKGAGDELLRITLSNGGVFRYSLPEDIVFLPGKKYTFDITVKQTGLTVTYTINDWGEGGNSTGDAEQDELQ